MPGISLRDRLIDPRSPTHRPRRAAYALPTLFTAGNIFLGFIAIVQSVEGSLFGNDGNLGSNPHFEMAAKAIGVAVVLDGVDGWIARMTNTVSDFGREMDSLADVITFGIAPAVLAYAWGVRGLPGLDSGDGHRLAEFGWIACLVFLVCCAWRLARFNVQGMAPGGSKFFVGMPTPAAAGMIAATVHAFKSPIQDWRIAWNALAPRLAR